MIVSSVPGSGRAGGRSFRVARQRREDSAGVRLGSILADQQRTTAVPATVAYFSDRSSPPGYLVGIAPLLGLRLERRREIREWAVLAADHVLYGVIVSRLGPPVD